MARHASQSETNLLTIIVYGFCVLIVGRPCAAAPPAAEVLSKAVAAVERISSLYCEIEILAEPDTEAAADSLIEFSGDDVPVFSFNKYWWDSRGMIRVESRVWQPERLRPQLNGDVYDHFVYTVDSDLYIGLSYSAKRAKKMWVSHSIDRFVTPLLFLGHNMTDLQQHLCRYIQEHGTMLEPQATVVSNGLQIAARYDPPNGKYRRHAIIVCDPDQDYLPVEIKTKFAWCDTMDQHIKVTQTEVISGIRVPVSGSASSYAIEEIYPDGLTIGDINAMPKEKYFAEIEPRVIRQAQLVSNLDDIYFSAASIRINEIKPLDFFRLQITAEYDLTDLTIPDDSESLASPPIQPSNEETADGTRSVPGEVSRSRLFQDPLKCLSLVVVVNISVIAGFRALRRLRGKTTR